MYWKKNMSLFLTVLMIGSFLVPVHFPVPIYAETENAVNPDENSASTTENPAQGTEHVTPEEPAEDNTGKPTEESTEKTEPSKDNDGPEAASTEEKVKETKPKAEKKKVVKDDSNGRDYRESEIISSGNTSFTIVSVSKNSEEIDRKIKKLQGKKKKLKEEKKKLESSLKEEKKTLDCVKAVYDAIDQSAETSSQKEIYMTGCLREGISQRRSMCVEGLDERLEELASQSRSPELIEWVKDYSTEYEPGTIEISTLDQRYLLSAQTGSKDNSGKEREDGSSNDPTATNAVIRFETSSACEEGEDIFGMGANGEIIYSTVAPFIEEIQVESEANYKNTEKELKEVKSKLKDVRSHIKTLKETKAANTIELDSRLLEYKDVIPDQTVDFLNAVVAKEGCPYVWGADGPNTFDCSGLISYGLRQCGAVSSGFRWTSYDFVSQLRSIPFSEAKPGDLVWKHGHIAVYIDENTVFEAPYTGARVRFTACSVSSRFTRVLRWWSED